MSDLALTLLSAAAVVVPAALCGTFYILGLQEGYHIVAREEPPSFWRIVLRGKP